MVRIFDIFRSKKEDDVPVEEIMPKHMKHPAHKAEHNSGRAGKFIVIEGNDGSGKSTQAKMLAEKFGQLSRDVEIVHFPFYDSFYGSFIKKHLQGGISKDNNPYLLAMAFANDRLMKKDQIYQWLEEGKIVIAVRYVASSKAYQSVKFKAPEEMQEFVKWVDEMEYDVNKLPRPDITIYLNVPADIAFGLVQQRSEKSKSRPEIYEKLTIMQKVEQVYLAMSKNKNWLRIDCIHGEEMLTKEEISDKIYQLVKNII